MRQTREPSKRVLRQREVAHKQLFSALRQSIAETSPKRILDVGTGYGMNVELLARRFRDKARIYSVDPSTGVLSRVRKMLRDENLSAYVTLRHAQAEALPFGDSHFDLVLSLLSLHHFSNPTKGLGEMNRVLSPEGKLVVADWKPVNSQVVPHSARDIPSPRFVTKELKRLGLSTELEEGRFWYLAEAVRLSKPY